MSTPPLLLVHGAVLLFGMAGLFGKWVDLPAVVIVLGRSLFAALFLGACLVLARRTAELRPTGGTLLAGALLAGHWTAFFRSIQLSTVAVGLLTFASFPVFAALLEPLLAGRVPARREVLLGLLATGGAALVVPWGVPDEGPGAETARGALWGLTAGFTFALLTVLNRRWVGSRSGLGLAFGQNLFAFLWLLPVAGPLAVDVTSWELGRLALLGTVFTGLSHALFIQGLRGVRARTASLVAALEPVYGTAAAAWLLAEAPELRTLLGGVVILGVVVVGTRQEMPGDPENS